MEFIEQKKRRPDPAQRDADSKEILKIRDDWVERHGMSKDRVDDALLA